MSDGAISVEAFDTFVPITQTLAQFAGQYDEFVEYNRQPLGNDS